MATDAPKLPKFLSTRHLKEWLTKSPHGKEILEELIGDLLKPEERKVLAVVHHDRIELYGYYLHLMEVQAIHGKTKNMERYAEVLVDKQLPESFKDLYWPGRANLERPGHIATLTPRKMSVQEWEWWQCYKENVLMLDQVGNTGRDSAVPD